MSIINVRSALEVAVNSMSPAISTSWENSEFTPASGVPYQAVFLRLANPENIEFGPVHRQPGVLFVNLFYPAKTGTLAAATRAQLIQDTFKRGNTYSSGLINVIISKTPYIGNGARDDDRWIIPVSIEFFTHIIS